MCILAGINYVSNHVNFNLISHLIALTVAGTNDKAGGLHYALKWTSPQAVKQTMVPLTDVKYPYMQEWVGCAAHLLPHDMWLAIH